MTTTIPNRLYLAGPMSGIAEYNRPLFNEVAEWLRNRGHEVFNPGENKDGGVKRPRSFYMRIDIPALMASDAIVLLPGWHESRGANLEVWIALDLDLPTYSYADSPGGPCLQQLAGLEVEPLPFARSHWPTAG